MFEDAVPAFTPLEDLGEFPLIRRLTAGLVSNPQQMICGPGDDAAVLPLSDTEFLLVSTDSMMELVHFDRMYTPLRHLGYKAVVTALSDIYAMNGLPTAITVALMVSNHYSVEQMEELYTGVREACRVHAVQLAGGDVSSSASGLGINVTVLGRVGQDRVTYRSGARPNDLLCVSGDLGAAFAGLNLLKREQAVFKANPGVQPDLSGYEYVLERQLRPEARRSVVEALAAIKLKPTSMIDISDGLASELHHLAKASGLGAMIYQNRLPIDHQTHQVAEDFEMAATEYALYGGEDYELLFTVPAILADQVRQLEGISIIGYMTPDHPGVRMIDNENTLTEIQPLGWSHFGQASKGLDAPDAASAN